MDRAFKGIWIPKEIWLNENLNIQEKVFIAEIDSLDNDDGCFASNEYFSKFFGLSKNRCSEIIKSLEKKGLITISYIYKENSKAIDKRVIKLVDKPIRDSVNGIRDIDRPIRDIDRPIRDIDMGYSKKCEDNNININNTINSTINKYIDLSFIDDVIDKVNLTKEQYEKLIQKYNKKQVHNSILALDNTLANNPKKYKDHYRTINNWCAKGYYKSEDGKSTKKGSFFNFKEREYDYDELEKVLTGEKYIDDEEERKLLGW